MKTLTNDEKFIKWVFLMFEKYKHVLFIDKFNFQVKKDPETIFLASKLHYPYLDATVLFSDDAVRTWLEDEQKVEKIIVHEFCHIITDPFYCMALQRFIDKTSLEEARERLTDHISQIVNHNLNLWRKK